MKVRLRPVEQADVEAFYDHQADPVANDMAAFAARDRTAHEEHYERRVFGDPNVVARTVLVDGAVAGHIDSWLTADDGRVVGYWIGREFWGRGVASEALRLYLAELKERPLSAYVAEHNAGSRRVLEKNGFFPSGEPHVADDGIVEVLFVLN